MRRVMPTRLLFAVSLIGACDLRADREPQGASADAKLTSPGEGCEFDSVRPATAAPAEGLWAYEDLATSHRVAAMVGPATSSAGAARVTRRVETLESRPDADTIRHASDTASVRLELIPPLPRPAAVYAVGPLVLLASYEPCLPGLREPLIRYLRQDHQGRVATDVMLQRDAHP
jgi:hypothetical protein